MAETVYLHSGTANPSPAPDEAYSRIYRSLKHAQSPDSFVHLEEKIRSQLVRIVGQSPALKTALDMVSVLAPSDSGVLILDETGSGIRICKKFFDSPLGSFRSCFEKRIGCTANAIQSLWM